MTEITFFGILNINKKHIVMIFLLCDLVYDIQPCYVPRKMIED